jgi:aryl-alcohol dehydrogenase
MSITATAAVVREPHGQFSLETVTVDDPRSDEIRVRIEASGICHTDILAQEHTPLPAVFGHEGAGVVEAVGTAVNRVKPGDRVIVSYPWCGVCPTCVEGAPYICDHAMPLSFAGTRLDGSQTITLNGTPISSAFFQQSSFATHAITLERDVVPVQSEHPAEMLAALACGVQTGAGAILNTMQVGAKHSLVVFGAGAVGLSAVMAGQLAGASPLIAVDVVEERLNLALELGATHTLNAREGNTEARIREIVPRGVDFTFETSANEQALNDAITSLCMGGQCGIVIAPHFGEKYPFSPTEILSHAATVRGIIQGSALPNTFLPKLIDLHQQRRFPYDRLLSIYDFADINQAFADTKAGKAIKPILKMA